MREIIYASNRSRRMCWHQSLLHDGVTSTAASMAMIREEVANDRPAIDLANTTAAQRKRETLVLIRRDAESVRRVMKWCRRVNSGREAVRCRFTVT
jgi:hypothetical protein